MLKRIALALALTALAAPAAFGAAHAGDAKLDSELRHRAHTGRGGHSRIILRLKPGVSADRLVKSMHGTLGRRLGLVNGHVADVPDSTLDAIAALPGVEGVSVDRKVQGTMERTGATIGSGWVRQNLGFDGTGVTVAIIDSGVTGWHDDLGSDKVVRFVDFVNFQSDAYDDYGHGTHVAGIIAGSGYDSSGLRTGVAPGASLVVEKVLDGTGQGYISNVIAAIDYAIASRDELNIRVINLSVAAGVYESYNTDPLTLAAKRAVEAGIVVVSAAGNLGKNALGQVQYGGVGAPGNAPWVITVGASSHMGTIDRTDDTVAGFSSRGPTAIDYLAKPDVVAPGVGTESITDASSYLFQTRPGARLWGTIDTPTQPYLSLSGTSMASPVVAGTIAMMLQANPALTPNLVKAVLEYTAENHAGETPFAQGAGYLNARGAVELARALGSGRSEAQSHLGDPTPWSRQIIWGNHRLLNGALVAPGSAWATDVTWGSAQTPAGSPVVWGASCAVADCDNIVWGTAADGENIVWGTSADGDNIVWGTGADGENIVWGTSADTDNIVWGTAADGENIVWGTSCDSSSADCDNIVWGTACEPGSADCDNIVWGTAADSDNIVWGTDCGGADCENIVWGTATGDADNIVWGTASDTDNIVWGTICDPGAADCDNIVWGTNVLGENENVVWTPSAARRNFHANANAVFHHK
jgi:serine protease AprX